MPYPAGTPRPASAPTTLRLLLLAAILAASFGTPSAWAQVCPGLTGAAARACVQAEYTPPRPLLPWDSKDRLYDTVDRTSVDGQDGVVGIYTGLFVPFDCRPNCDPSQDVYNNNASATAISQEHVWPRSEGTDSEPAEVDLHHLFPSRNRVNGARSNRPFADIPDGSAAAWYRGSEERSSPPPEAERDLWSERSSSRFEPREAVKGDLARALFYVHAVYEGGVSEPFFGVMVETLLRWHAADPATQAEVDRSGRVAALQGNENPFVLDATLAARAYGTATPAEAEPSRAVFTLLAPYPHPARAATTLTLTARQAESLRVAAYDALGRRVAVLFSGPVAAGTALDVRAETAGWPAGLYLVRAEGASGAATRRLVVAR